MGETVVDLEAWNCFGSIAYHVLSDTDIAISPLDKWVRKPQSKEVTQMDRVAWRDWQGFPCASALLRYPADWDFNSVQETVTWTSSP